MTDMLEGMIAQLEARARTLGGMMRQLGREPGEMSPFYPRATWLPAPALAPRPDRPGQVRRQANGIRIDLARWRTVL